MPNTSVLRRLASVAVTPTTGVAVLLLAVVALYLPVSQYEAISFDDNFVFENSEINKGFSLRGLWWCLTNTSYYDYWHPLPWISHMIDFGFYGHNAGGHHLSGLLFHLLCVYAAYRAMSRLAGSAWVGLACATLLGVHTVHVESVAWIVERKDVLAGLFFFLTINAYLAYRQSGSTRWYAGSVLLYAIGLMSKPMLVTLPFLLYLLDYWHASLTDPARAVGAVFTMRNHRDKVPFFVLSIGMTAFTYFVVASKGYTDSLSKFPLDLRLGNAVVSYATYLRKLVVPHDLSLLYPFPDRIPPAAIIASLAVLLALCTGAWFLRRLFPALLVGLLWFLGTLVPTIGLVKSGYQSMADRFLYIPAVGIYFALCASAFAALRGSKPGARLAAILGFSAIVAALVSYTASYIPAWKSNEAIYANAIRVTGPNKTMLLNYAVVLADKNYVPEAANVLRRALEIDSNYALANANLSIMLARLRRYGEAREYAERAVRLAPFFTDARLSLAFAHAHSGNDSLASFHANLAVENCPQSWAVWERAATVVTVAGRKDEARKLFRAASEYNNKSWKPYYARAELDFFERELDSASHYFAMAIERGPTEASVLTSAGLCELLRDSTDRAIALLGTALELAPRDCDALSSMEFALRREGRAIEADSIRSAVPATCDTVRTRNRIEGIVKYNGGH